MAKRAWPIAPDRPDYKPKGMPMCPTLSLVVSLYVPLLGCAAEPSFDDILQGVKQRESRTGAITRVRSTPLGKAEGAPDTWWYFEITIKGKTAKIEMYSNYLTGRKGESFEFPVGTRLKEEYKRLEHLKQLRTLDKAVADAERRRRIYLLSKFQLTEGDESDAIETALGKPTEVMGWMRAGWSTWVYPDLRVTVGNGRAHDVVKAE